jgi:hypothetical protein
VPYHDHAVLKATSQGHGTARQGHGMACVNYHRPFRNGMWATYSRSVSSDYHVDFYEGHGTLGEWQECGTAWTRHGICELALIFQCVTQRATNYYFLLFYEFDFEIKP